MNAKLNDDDVNRCDGLIPTAGRRTDGSSMSQAVAQYFHGKPTVWIGSVELLKQGHATLSTTTSSS